MGVWYNTQNTLHERHRYSSLCPFFLLSYKRSSGQGPDKQMEFHGKNSKIRSFRVLNKLVAFVDKVSVKTPDSGRAGAQEKYSTSWENR